MNIVHAVGWIIREVIVPFLSIVGAIFIVLSTIELATRSSRENQKRQDFKECVDMTHSAMWCYDKIR